MQDLSDALAGPARKIAEKIANSGKRAWIVGGAPRDLALGRSPAEIDLASAATPEEIEGLFESTVPVGRPFGTVIVRVGGDDYQHTTFRSEGAYSDARRPDSVAFGATPEADSTRRDFTCNAIYLDPLSDEVLDPQGGLADLAANRLRCVGDASARFREDGLRLLRLARFAAALELEPDAATMAAARASGESLRGVSPERVLGELSKIFSRPGALRALSILVDLDLLGRAVPGLATESSLASWWEPRKKVLAALPAVPGLALGLAAVFGTAEGLRPSRALRARVAEIGELADLAPRALAGPRSERVRWMRGDAFPEAAELARARAAAIGADASAIEAALREREQLGAAGLFPAPLVAPADLEERKIQRGPRWGEILREAERLQLDGRLASRADALAWLAGQEGGKTPRKT
jgi:tRNA nucleotidyltransferase/poly(A) polymerase